jgi:trehalose 6-phosphate synthase/phosphatase
MSFEVPRTLSSRTRDAAAAGGRLLIVSNRLPVTLVEDGDHIAIKRSSGGLAAGLACVQRRHRASWIGWTGLAECPREPVRVQVERQLRSSRLIPVNLTRREVDGFYHRFSNDVLWPLLHDIEPARHDILDWETYRRVNMRFADAIVRELNAGDCVWVHDYHLMLVPRLVRERCPWAQIGFFLHTPFPEPETFARLPQAAVLLDGLIGADAVGMHTDEYVQRFLTAVDETGMHRTHHHVIHDGGRPVAVSASPMGIDAEDFDAVARQMAVTQHAGRLRGTGPLFVGIDRLDYTKGIPERLRAFERLLEDTPALVGRARLLQIAVPSREAVNAYQRVRAVVEEIVRRVNRRWGTGDWVPIDYRYTCVDSQSLVALYRAADVMLVTPIRDGLNLVAKEFVASRIDNDGVLVLSARAGAAAELRTALLVDPTSEDSLADAYSAALNMLPAERRVRMRHMRLRVAAHNIYRWADSVLGMLGTDGLSVAGVGGT